MGTKDKRLCGTFDVGVFNVRVHVFRSAKKMESFLRDIGACDAGDISRAAYGQAHWGEDDDGVSWFSICIEDDANDATRVHECCHMADFIMEEVGVPCTFENTEIRAYLTAEIYRKLNEVLE